MDQTVLITGATSGIGLATAKAIARRGALVILHGRTRDTADAAAAEVRAAVPDATLETVAADLGSLAAVRAMADELRERFERLDVLIHNAGLERWERETTERGHELTLTVNHLAPFLLTRRLLPLLARSKARVIFVSSMVHAWGQIHWDDLMAEGWYAPEAVYYQSKLAAALAALELARRVEPLGVTVLLAPPGLTRTRFGRDFRGFAAWWARVVGRLAFRDPAEVGEELAELALAARFEGVTGAYVDRLRVGHPAPSALVREDQLRMWKRTCELLNLPNDEPPSRADPPAGRPETRPPSLGRWTGAVVGGELVGFTATVIVAWIAVQIGGVPESVGGHVIAAFVMGFAGVLEGASLGWFQARPLRRFLPRLTAKAWMLPTAVLAATGWLIGMCVPLLFAVEAEQAGAPPAEPGMGLVVAFAAAFGALMGALIGSAQWLVLRRHVTNAGRWIAGNAVGWGLGLPVTYVAGDLVGEDAPLWLAAVIAATAAVLMGVGAALGTWGALRTLKPRALP